MQKFGVALEETVRYIYLALKALRFWHRPPPIKTPDELVEYVDTRSKFVAQTTLYGYVKTRAGTRYVSLFEDEVFVQSLNIAKWEIYLACLADLAVFCAASVSGQTPASDDEIRSLAIYLVDCATRNEEIPAERPQGFEDIRSAFRARVQQTPWKSMVAGESAFQGSLDALVEWAPIADVLKIDDAEVVKNSMRFKWKKVRDQFNSLIDAESVLDAWQIQEERGNRLEAAHAS